MKSFRKQKVTNWKRREYATMKETHKGSLKHWCNIKGLSLLTVYILDVAFNRFSIIYIQVHKITRVPSVTSGNVVVGT